MNKFRLFVENFMVYGMGSMISKFIPFFMIPIVIRLMPDSSYYGISELFNTAVQFASTFILFGMYDSMFRFFFENEDSQYKAEICSTAFSYTLVNSLLVFFLINFFRDKLAILFFGRAKYRNLLTLASFAAVIGASNSMLGAPTRMLNDRKRYLIINALAPIISYSLSFILLLNEQYEIALPLGVFLSNTAIAVIFLLLNHRWFCIKSVKIHHLKELMTVAFPVVPITLIYWIFNSCDKLMITNILSVDDAGIYSVGAKFGAISQLIYAAFSGGWQYFAYSTMNDDNQKEVNSRIFEYLGIVSFGSAIAVSVVIYDIFKLLFNAEYLKAYIITPYLFLSPLIQMLFQILCSQYTIHKKSWMNMMYLIAAAVINIFLNYFQIPCLGIEGAALSTLTGYICAVIISLVIAVKLEYAVISVRMIASFIVTAVYFVMWRLWFSEFFLTSAVSALIVFSFYAFFYRKELKMFYGFLRNLELR